MTTTSHRIAVIQWPVKDVERSLRWYQDVLGLSLTFPYTPGDPAAWLCLGESGFGLVQAKEVPRLAFTDIQGQLQSIVQFQVNDIHGIYQQLQAKQVKVSAMKFIEDGGHSFSFNDLDGNTVSLWGGWPQPAE
ncbi:hypothetical protein JCM10914A_26540 [Paenibacillus sp. JCM 10914]|uniref:VOC family protein n=1 Tax=Paenibacillus sp. JCM 10914 TaxID=1236974 RepID=UPI0003CCB65A|nr:VOC family protein [Paenibacillus sp. JCM 10914]GAE07731.1 hypothetical protein JCM10914_3974 [Paenibacillus sp. JCM 10914]